MSFSYNFVSEKAVIHSSVEIGPFTTIYDDVVIGKNTWIGPNVTLFSGARIGENCKIFPGAVIAAIPQDLKFHGEYSEVFIGNNTVIRECVTVNRGTDYSGSTNIGKNCLIMAYSHVAHDCKIGDNVILSNSNQLAGHVEIGDFAVIGGASAVHQFVKIGKYAMIGGGSLVRKDVPPFVKVSDEPLKFIGINLIGLRRNNFSEETINEIQSVYKAIYQSNQNITQAIEYVKLHIFSELANEICQFIADSKRGIIKKSSVSIDE